MGILLWIVVGIFGLTALVFVAGLTLALLVRSFIRTLEASRD